VLNSRGFSLIELMIGIAIMAMIMFVALPAFTQWLQNTQIRNAAESTLTGLNAARNEAIRHNRPVRFQFVSSLDSTCTVSASDLANSSSLSWIVSNQDPSGACQTALSQTAALDTGALVVLKERSATEGTANVQLTSVGGATVTFSGLGRMSGAGITQLDFKNKLGTCTWQDATHGTMRCLRILINSGGQIRMCDPKLSKATNPMGCQ